ncbi:hypothetical protein OAS39_09630 [Pirellulales bacterium]|nr:hypothetical protein [Pirellulales bacterium]
MDRTDYPSLPRLNQLHAQLAAQCRRVERTMAQGGDPVEQLIRATVDGNWNAALNAALSITETAEVRGDRALLRIAQATENVLRADPGKSVNTPRTSSQLAELLAACRAMKLRERER